MVEIFKILGTIAINTSEAEASIDSTTSHARTAFTKIGNFAIDCGKVIAKGLAVGGVAFGALLKNSIGEYAEYEQLVGGIETLFQESKGKVMGYANEAYRTAGMSANEYMSTVTSFSARLLQGLGGDTELAADMANMAITDMADNANKMGTSMESIQNAYQGFAKQNYTMLDNLSLGYGGTQAEMARLINDSGVLGEGITVTAETVNQVPFDKIIEAIHIIQTEMGITGTTAKEASETILGSFAAFKSTWRNLMTGFASEDQNINVLFSNFLEAGKTLAHNVVRLLPVIGNNLKRLFSTVVQYINNGMATSVWPKIQEWFKFKFDIELPDWETFKTNVSTWWTNTTTKIGNVCKWTLKHLGIAEWTDEDTEALRAWWDGVYEKIVSACQWLLNPELPDAETVINDILAWWERVKKSVKLVLGITVQNEATIAAYGNDLSNVASSVGSAVASATGSSLLGGLAQQNVDNFSRNSDSFIDFGSIFHALGVKGYATGLDRVPYDNFPALLHKDEAVLNAAQATTWRNGNTANLEAKMDSLIGMLRQLIGYNGQIASNTANGHQMVLDTGAIVAQLLPAMDAGLGTVAVRKGRRNG